MWESFDFGDMDILWTCTPFVAGIGGQQDAPCGAVSAGAVCLGLIHRETGGKKEEVKLARHRARQNAAEFVNLFRQEFGNITCSSLIGIDFSKPGEYKRFLDSKIWVDKCMKYAQFTVEKLIGLIEKKRAGAKKV
ncbi:MAG: C_GCAxxG_C_C family protein [Deltaproteobacteria bacterium]|uniref:C_GCAxxG_C_C family protein n=1 Tax=Candidatus Zymogenus saltonus TaxID=2844893 RepID=A0A9D8PMT0_9DELT|nr:C_GCAxxG_C_C family protein [Candidatus Zymogenus saltonus]